jgi:hypothetical protein
MLAQLQEIFPGFVHEWDEDEWPGMSRTFHGVVRDITEYFVATAAACSESQLQHFASWLNGSVEAGGDIENAVSTCFLEHSHQLGFYGLLVPHLSPLAGSRTHA